MNKHDIERLKFQLLALQEELLKQEEDFKESSQVVELDQSKVGRLSRMDAMQAQQMALESSRRRQLRLEKVAKALRRLSLSEYGYCLQCDEEIDLRRLNFDPVVSYCIQCAEKLE